MDGDEEHDHAHQSRRSDDQYLSSMSLFEASQCVLALKTMETTQNIYIHDTFLSVNSCICIIFGYLPMRFAVFKQTQSWDIPLVDD